MGMHTVAEKYLRVQEYPFNSDQKVMAVKCVLKDHPVCENYYMHCICELITFKSPIELRGSMKYLNGSISVLRRILILIFVRTDE